MIVKEEVSNKGVTHMQRKHSGHGFDNQCGLTKNSVATGT